MYVNKIKLYVRTQIFAWERKHFGFERRYLHSNAKVCNEKNRNAKELGHGFTIQRLLCHLILIQCGAILGLHLSVFLDIRTVILGNGIF